MTPFRLKLVLFLIALKAHCQEPGFRTPDALSTSPKKLATNDTGLINPGAAVLNSMEVLDNNHQIATGDTISIRILEDRRDALQQVVAVTGEVQAPYVGLISAKGRTCKDLAFTLKKELEKNFFKNATVVIAIDRLNTNDQLRLGTYDLEFYVMFGFVAKQGKYDLPSNEDISISQAILRSGGFAAFANKEKVKIIRKTPQGNRTILVNVDGIMRNGDLERDIFLRKDDVVIVEELIWNF